MMTLLDNYHRTAPDDPMFRHSQVEVGQSSVHVVEEGDPQGAPVLFLHGWPESWFSWRAVMELASKKYRAIAVDLPGIGGSTGDATDGTKAKLAETVHELISKMELKDVTLVGQDVGGMVVYAYLRAYDDLAAAVIMDVVIPGLDPWEEVLRNPYIWHFALHNVPKLPERLVQGSQRIYFDYFYDILTKDRSSITPEARAIYVHAYERESALTAGFNWYRAFSADAKANRESSGVIVKTPLLYLRGEHESGDIDRYLRAFHEAGVRDVRKGIVHGSGHFTQEESPEETWTLISTFIGDR